MRCLFASTLRFWALTHGAAPSPLLNYHCRVQLLPRKTHKPRVPFKYRLERHHAGMCFPEEIVTQGVVKLLHASILADREAIGNVAVLCGWCCNI
jgi:hypothetical protein